MEGKYKEMERVELSENDPLGPLSVDDSADKLDDWRFKGLSFEQEIYLKKLIIKHALDKEFEIFSANPSLSVITSKTILLYYIYSKCLVEFPLFKNKDSAIHSKLEELLVQYPAFSSLMKKATNDKGRSGVLVDIFDVLVVSTGEIQTKEKLEEGQIIQLMKTFSARREILECLQILLQDVVKAGSASSLFKVFLDAKSMDDMPHLYQQLFGVKYLAPVIMERLQEPRKLQRMKASYALIPRRSLKALFTMTSPVTVISNLFTLFLSKIGSKNLIQNFAQEAVEIPRVTEEILEKRKVLQNKNIADKVEAWVSKHYDPIPHVNSFAKSLLKEPQEQEDEKDAKGLVMQVLLDNTTKPEFEPAWVNQLNKEAIQAIYRLAICEMRLKDRNSFVEMLGDEKFIGPVKDIVAELCPPLVQLTNNSNFSTLLSSLFKLMKEIIHCSELEQDLNKQVQAYNESLKKFESVLLPSFQGMIKSDNGTLGDLILWATDFFDVNQKIQIDLNKIMQPLREEDKLLISTEVDTWINFKKKEKKMRKAMQSISNLYPPQQTAIPKLLVDPFLQLVRPSLQQTIKTFNK